ncbi:MAG: trypsin-like serine protease [Ilumatobacteraceae bacterium]
MQRSITKALTVGVLCASGLSVASSAGAITNGTTDQDGHPNVGGLVSATQYSDDTWIYCSGTLISPTVFLTAAHCGDDGESVRVTFDTAYQDGDEVFVGTFEADPAYSQVQSDPHDIAVVVLDDAIENIEPALLPAVGSLSTLPKSQPFTAVGYGAYEVTNEPGGHQYLYDDVRMTAIGRLNAVNPAWLRISMNPARNDGGTCYGDSGGPDFLGTSDTVAAITITGDAVCRSTNVVYRLDTQAARMFLMRYVDVP